MLHTFSTNICRWLGIGGGGIVAPSFPSFPSSVPSAHGYGWSAFSVCSSGSSYVSYLKSPTRHRKETVTETANGTGYVCAFPCGCRVNEIVMETSHASLGCVTVKVNAAGMVEETATGSWNETSASESEWIRPDEPHAMEWGHQNDACHCPAYALFVRDFEIDEA